MPGDSVGSQDASCQRFQAGGFHGEVAGRFAGCDLAAEVARLGDPAAAVATIHWGRNYLYAAELRTPDGPVPVVVKQFRNQGWRQRLERRLRGSKAERSWRGALAVASAGIATPEPILLAESDAADGPSLYVSRWLEGAVEVRHFFRRLAGRADAGPFPEVDELGFLGQLGRFCRSIHDAGIWYRDLSMGNVLARPLPGGGLELAVVDCNRARWGRRLGVVRRIRDSCRFPILEAGHGAAFLAGYWGEVPRRTDSRSWFWALAVRGFLAKHAIKNRLRELTRRLWRPWRGRPHPHIPAAATGAAARDRIVWDELSDQPHQHASGRDKLAIRLADGPEHLRDLAVVARSAPAVWRRFRALRAGLYREPRPFDGIGLAVRPYPQDPDAQLAAIEELGVRRILLRLHPWQNNHEPEHRLAAELHRRGFELAFALPQNRDLVRDRARWRAAIEEIASRFAPYGRHFQIGQAPNRSKWGIWTRREYVELYLEASEILRRRPEVEVVGPAVIDFEYQVTVALANRSVAGLRFDVLTSLLYVDRRGAPESRQLGFDTVDKVVLLRAIASEGRNSVDRCWITEFNWPLWEGPHSPAGKAVSVDEATQADYLARYYLLALGTGLVERVYWWQLVARGYGLVCPEGDGSLRRRPSFCALRTLAAELGGATFLGPLPAPEGGYLYRFAKGGQEVVVGWAIRPGTTAELPRPPVRSIDRNGGALSRTDGVLITLGPSPVYYTLAD